MKFVAFAAFLLFAWRRLHAYLHIYQQEEYQPLRFLRWLVVTRSFDMRASAAVLVLAVFEHVVVLAGWMTALIVIAILLIFASLERRSRKVAKKPLVMTSRAKRIFYTAFGCAFAITLGIVLASDRAWSWVIAIQLIPFTLVAGNALLVPYERSVQRRFWNEAHSKLLSLRPTVIGITGSFGKTSTKHLLGHILEMQAPTLITPGSVNTPMGISRVIREQLWAQHRFFVCEMGAYGPGSIARLCRLAPPDVAVLTAIGMAHYERFKTLDTVAKAKFELPEAAEKRGGITLLAEQVLQYERAKEFLNRNRAKTIVVGAAPEAELRVISTAQKEDGILAEVVWRGEPYILRAPIFGQHHISNMALAFATACSLGVPPKDAVLALASTPQINHRLEVRSGPGGSRLIDDAYNSNPVGFASGLRLLSALAKNGGRRVLVTPGMVELGPAHDEEHRKVGELAAQHVDYLLAVVPERIKSLTASYTQARPDGALIPCPDFAAAQAWMNQNLRADDVVLLENDLPDLYEKKLNL